MHPDANPNPNIKWLDTLTRKAMAAAGVGASLDFKNRWSHSEKSIVPLDTSISNQISMALSILLFSLLWIFELRSLLFEGGNTTVITT